MASIRDAIIANMPETYNVLNGQNYVGEDGVDVFDRAIAQSMELLLKPGVTEAQLTSEFVKAYIGDFATRRLIPMSIDYWQVKSRRSDSMQRPPGVTPLGGESSQNYDRVAGMQALDKMLAERLLRDLDEFLEMVGDNARPRASRATNVMRSSTQGTTHRTQSPSVLDPIDDIRKLRVTPFGVIAPVSEN